MSQVLYFYGEKPFKNGKKQLKRRVTIAGVISDGNILRIGMAECSVKDQFVKKVGRAKAFGRAIGNKYKLQTAVPTDVNPIQFFIDKAKQIIS